MKTKIVATQKGRLNREDLMEAARLIKDGELVAFPTETVYGLGADAFNDEAVRKIFQVKGRPQDNPLILHVSSIAQLLPLVSDVKNYSRALINAFWPGPITFVFNASPKLNIEASTGLSTIAVRMPDNQIGMQLITESGTAIAAPSANISGRPSPTRAKDVILDLDGKIPMIIDGGDTNIGLESTILDITGDVPIILRPGAISIEDIRKITPDVKYFESNNQTEIEKPPAPGMKYRHYAPKASMFVFNGDEKMVIDSMIKSCEKHKSKGKRVGILCADEFTDLFDATLVLAYGSIKDKKQIARNFFSKLRDFDDAEVDVILAEAVDSSEIGMAIMNRMAKACGGNIISV